jgi:hypothetical protein
MSKMQFIFFVPPNEELEGTLDPQKFGCTPKNEGKRVHVPPDEKTCGHALRFFYVEDRTLKRHKSIGVFVVYIDTGSSMPISPSKSRDLADENNKILTE